MLFIRNFLFDNFRVAKSAKHWLQVSLWLLKHMFVYKMYDGMSMNDHCLLNNKNNFLAHLMIAACTTFAKKSLFPLKCHEESSQLPLHTKYINCIQICKFNSATLLLQFSEENSKVESDNYWKLIFLEVRILTKWSLIFIVLVEACSSSSGYAPQNI